MFLSAIFWLRWWCWNLRLPNCQATSLTMVYITAPSQPPHLLSSTRAMKLFFHALTASAYPLLHRCSLSYRREVEWNHLFAFIVLVLLKHCIVPVIRARVFPWLLVWCNIQLRWCKHSATTNWHSISARFDRRFVQNASAAQDQVGKVNIMHLECTGLSRNLQVKHI